jgi:predicted amidohydrolase
MNLVALQFQTGEIFEDNLKRLISLLEKTPSKSIILAPEVSLSNFCYERFPSASEFSKKALEKIAPLTKDRVFALTVVENIDGKYFNILKVFKDGEIIFQQKKNRLFPLGDEPKHFSSGDISEIKTFEVYGLKVSSLICFELRFTSLWEILKGSDIILVPAMWGKPRKDNFETLSKALAIANQCFVIASNSSNYNMAKSSAIISPFGNVFKDDSSEIVISDVDLSEIEKMRRYIDVGITK